MTRGGGGTGRVVGRSAAPYYQAAGAARRRRTASARPHDALNPACLILLAAAGWAPPADGSAGDGPAADRDRPVLAHSMPWYASREVSGAWGRHWTMGRFDPDRVGPDGRRELASTDRPLLGPYDSSDDDLLACHAQLMKLAGLDGAIMDWYGTAEFRDYAAIHKNVGRFVPHLRRAGLRFAICYEDQTVGHLLDAGRLPAGGGAAEGARTLRRLADDWFADPAYVRVGGRPLLLVFGPQQFPGESWAAVAADLPGCPATFGLPHLADAAGLDGAFGWPPVSGNRVIPRAEWRAYLADLHARDRFVSVAFPGFRDVYQQAGLHDSYGSIDPADGETFRETLAAALASDAVAVQIATWNDHGEGTAVEPTENHGYRYLEALQAALAPDGRYTPADLRLPVRLYRLQKSAPGDPVRSAALRTASDLLNAGRCAEAGAILETTPAPAP